MIDKCSFNGSVRAFCAMKTPREKRQSWPIAAVVCPRTRRNRNDHGWCSFRSLCSPRERATNHKTVTVYSSNSPSVDDSRKSIYIWARRLRRGNDGMITCMTIFPPSTNNGEYATPMRLVNDADNEERRVSVEKETTLSLPCSSPPSRWRSFRAPNAAMRRRKKKHARNGS
jgi:hypothetical protein